MPWRYTAKGRPVIVVNQNGTKITGNFEFHIDPNITGELSTTGADLAVFRWAGYIFMTRVKCAMPWFLYATSHSNRFNNFLKRSSLYNKNYPLR